MLSCGDLSDLGLGGALVVSQVVDRTFTFASSGDMLVASHPLLFLLDHLVLVFVESRLFAHKDPDAVLFWLL